MWTETDLHPPSYPPEPANFLQVAIADAQGGVALQTRTYLALMVLLEVIFYKNGFSSFRPIVGGNQGGCLRGEQEPLRVTGSTCK